jgi:hypothetical protein
VRDVVTVEMAEFPAPYSESKPPRGPGPASTPGHDVTSRVICWLAEAVSCALLLPNVKMNNLTGAT